SMKSRMPLPIIYPCDLCECLHRFVAATVSVPFFIPVLSHLSLIESFALQPRTRHHVQEAGPFKSPYCHYRTLASNLNFSISFAETSAGLPSSISVRFVFSGR